MKFLILAFLPAMALGELAGGITDTTVSATYEPVVFAVKAVNAQFAKNNGGTAQELQLLEVVHARTQVVAGQKLYLTLHLTGDYYCDVSVWYRQWLQGDERLIITDGPTCKQHQTAAARSILGGPLGGVSDPKPLPHDGNPTLMQALEFAACAMNDRINSMFASTLGDTSAVTYTEQVTAGMTYSFFNVPMMATTCRNNGCANMDPKTCPVNVHNGQTMTCNFVVQSQPWMNPPFTLTNLSC